MPDPNEHTKSDRWSRNDCEQHCHGKVASPINSPFNFQISEKNRSFSELVLVVETVSSDIFPIEAD